MYKRLTSRKCDLFSSLIETWKDIKGFEGHYQISSFGRVKSVSRWRDTHKNSGYITKEKIMKQKRGLTGYYSVGICLNAVQTFKTIHRLVAEHFVTNADDKPTVNHIDGDKANNKVSNLEWSTHSEQMVHAFKHDLLELRGSEKFPLEVKLQVLNFMKENEGVSIRKTAKLFNMSRRTVQRIVTNGIKTRPTTRVLKDGSHIVEDVISQEAVSEIKRLRNEGYTLSSLSKMFNRSISQIHRISKGMSRNEK